MKLGTGDVMFSLTMHEVHLPNLALNRFLIIVSGAIVTPTDVFFPYHILGTSVMTLLLIMLMRSCVARTTPSLQRFLFLRGVKGCGRRAETFPVGERDRLN